MEQELRTRLRQVLSKHDSEMEIHDLRFLRARASYLSNDQIDRLNRLLEGVEGIEPINKKSLPKKRTIVSVDVPEEETKPALPKASLPDQDLNEEGDSDDEEDPDMPEDSGDLQVIDDEDDEDLDEEGDLDEEDPDVVDLDDMNLDQLKGVAKDLGINGYHFFKDEEKLRKRILETYETSKESADANEASEDEGAEE